MSIQSQNYIGNMSNRYIDKHKYTDALKIDSQNI